jgi:hypothetical protein
VIVEEAHEGLRRVVEHLPQRRRPDARRHRQQVAIPERGAEAGFGDEIPDRKVEILAPVQQRRRQAVEAQDVVRHAQERRACDVAALREVAGKGAAVLEPALVEADREGHVGIFGRHAEVIEQRDEVWIVAIVEDDEAHVDRTGPLGHRRLDSAGMAAETVLALVDDHVVAATEEPGGSEAGYAGADDGDFHCTKTPLGTSTLIS